MRGWPVTLTEPHLLERPVSLRPVRVSDARMWREIRVRNAPWLRPWEPTNPETPLYRSSLGPYIAMVRAMRREARQGQAIPWVVTYGGEFVGQLTVGSITWGSARSGQVGYWIDEAFAGRGIIPTTLAMAVDHCFGVIGLHRLEASIRPENHASRRVVEKLGLPRGGHPGAPAAHQRGLAGPRVLRADRRRGAAGADAQVAEHPDGDAPDRELTAPSYGECCDTPSGVLV